MDPFSYIANADTAAIAAMYESFKNDPNSVDSSWRDFFKGFDFAQTWSENSGGSSSGDDHIRKEMSVISLIKAFRSRGHLLANTNPVRKRVDRKPRLSLADYSLNETDLETVFQAGNFLGIGPAKLKDIVETLNLVYANKVGFEYSYIREMDAKEWLRTKIEKEARTYQTSIEEARQILTKLNEAVVFENFLG
ncbi:MAG: hypothetical protein RIR51_1954, partial [Bacteroidota bacterium]